MNATHSPQRTSWVTTADQPGSDFPIQNLPFGVFQSTGGAAIGIAIGDQILNLRGCGQAGLLASLPAGTQQACAAEVLNPLMALGMAHWSPLRALLSDLLRSDHPQAEEHRRALTPHLCPQQGALMLAPVIVGNYTDFYASIDHAARVGTLFRPENPLLPNYKFVPIGYHGRASSLCISGTPITRPAGQWLRPGAPLPHFGFTESLDYEVEAGFFAGPGNRAGESIPIHQAPAHLFGMCLVNDWSARDIQTWEYQPLGPFLSKSFATTLSPWVITMEALEPFRCPASARPAGDPAPLDYLASQSDQRDGGIDVVLEVYLQSARMQEPMRLSRGNLSHLYWTAAQLLTHHASNGCPLQPGDLLASGTVSGPEDDARGCLLEITSRGTNPLALPTGEHRTFLEDGDRITLRGFCEREGLVRIGLGECTGTIRAGITH